MLFRSSLLDILLQFDAMAWDRQTIRAHAEQFSVEKFKRTIRQYVEDKYKDYKETQRLIG